MYRVLIITTYCYSSGSGGAGAAVTQDIVEFQSKTVADAAVKQIDNDNKNGNGYGNTTAIKLYE